MPDSMETLIGVVVFVILIAASIGLHEWGHYVTARRFGAKITEFMIGFGPLLVRRRRGETQFGLKAVPVGGYVRILGMYPPAQHEADVAGGRFGDLVADARRQSLAELGPADEHRAFYRLPVRQRVVVMLAGPVMNLLIAIALFTAMLVGVGLPNPTTTIQAVIACAPSAANPQGVAAADGTCPDGAPLTAAAQAGLQPGDIVESVADVPTPNWDDLGAALASRTGSMDVVIVREGRTSTRTVVLAPVEYPVLDERGRPTGETERRTLLGVRPQVVLEPLPLTAVPAYMWDMTARSVQALMGMPARLYELGETLITDGERQLDSPVSVVGVTRLGGEVAAAEEPFAAKLGTFLGLAASLNLFLFLFNLLPVLPLDGGHVAAALWEGARRRWAVRRHRPDPGPVDTARLLPVTYSVAIVLIGVGVMVIWADIVKPITLGG